MADPLEALRARWQQAAQSHPVARRFLPWAERLLDGAEVSRTCSLSAQADILLDRVSRRLESIETSCVSGREPVSLSVGWSSDGLPPAPDIRRVESLHRQVRTLRAHRMPFRGEGHPGFRGLAWGPYNRQSAVAEALSAVAALDPLRVDDILERERSLRAIDSLLGLAP